MDERKKKKIINLLTDLNKICRELSELLSEDLSDSVKSKGSNAEFKAKEVLEGIMQLDRQAAAEKMREMKHRELGELFKVAGGSSTEKKRPKEWLIDRIIWMVFDFKHCHETIRSMD